MSLKNDRYAYRVVWSEDDHAYVGLCAEFQSLSWLAATPEAALKGIRKVVAESVEILKEDGDEIPQPIYSKEYSGKFIVRVTPEIHRDLALQAAESGVSLNKLASAKLGRR